MYRIGIIGSDNSHAEAFSKLVNIPDAVTGEYAYPDCRVTGIFGLVKERTEQVARDGRIDFIAERPEDMIGKVDAVMVVFRHGDLHLQYALPFIKAGIPTWIDKPFAIKKEDARALIEEARAGNTLLTGGSTCKYICDIMNVKNAVQNGSRIGKVKSAAINFPADLDSEYGGLHFYGPHLAEMTMAAFGYDAKSVLARENNGTIIALLQYDRYQVAMNFTPGLTQYSAILYGEHGTIFREIDISSGYKLGFESFLKILRTGQLPPKEMEKLYAQVELLNAVLESCESGREVQLKGL